MQSRPAKQTKEEKNSRTVSRRPDLQNKESDFDCHREDKEFQTSREAEESQYNIQ